MTKFPTVKIEQTYFEISNPHIEGNNVSIIFSQMYNIENKYILTISILEKLTISKAKQQSMKMLKYY